MRRYLFAAVVVVAGLGIAGCGIAHKRVYVPPLEVHLELSDKSGTPIEIVRPEFYGQTEALVALTTDAVTDKYPAYERRSIKPHGVSAIEFTFAKEDRYIGYAIVLAIPIGPDSETSKSRIILLRVGDGDIHRVSILGDAANVEKTSIAVARATLPALLVGARPNAGTPEWRAWFDAETAFYRSLRWDASSELSVVDVKRTTDRDLVFLKIGQKRDS